MIILLLAVLGLIFGSFVNALVWRLRQQELAGQKSKIKGQKSKVGKAEESYSILRGRSMCPTCHHELKARDLVPVLSWLTLRGRCRYCQAPISWQYPVVELLTAAVFALTYLWWPLSLQGADLFRLVAVLGFLVVFMALAVYDLRWFLLPNRLVFPLVIAVAIEVVIVGLNMHDWRFVLNSALGGALIFVVFYLLFQVSNGAWIGGGDVKLALGLGMLAGTPLKALLVLFLASVIGTAVSAPQLARGRQGLKVKVPFGPLLLIATWLAVLFGDQILNWYMGLLT